LLWPLLITCYPRHVASLREKEIQSLQDEVIRLRAQVHKSKGELRQAADQMTKLQMDHEEQVLVMREQFMRRGHPVTKRLTALGLNSEQCR
jgi:hypothetical protein